MRRREHNRKIFLINLIVYFILVCIDISFITCDLYFGFNNQNICKNNKFINLNNYLIISGYSRLIFLIDGSIILNSKRDLNSNLFYYLFIFLLFLIVWDIFEAIIFLGGNYNQDDCNGSISTYIFVSLIIKLLTTWLHGRIDLNTMNIDND